jgi:large subunit ribosomal protein L2
MGIITYKPTSAGRRGMTANAFSELTKGKRPEKSLTVGAGKSGGRGNTGHVTAYQRGGGHKRRYRVIDFKRDKVGVPARSRRSSTTRTAAPASRCCTTPTARSATSWPPSGIKVGDEWMSAPDADIKPGATRCRCATSRSAP